MKAKSRGSRVRKSDTARAGNGDGNGQGQKPAAAPAPSASERRMPRPELTSDMLGGLLTSEAKYKKDLLSALTALKKGDFSIRLPVDWPGMEGKIADTFNDVIGITDRLATEVERLSRVVGKEGKISQRVSVGEVSGSWAAKVAAINGLISDLVHPISETARVLGAVAKGDLSQTMALEIEGRPLEGEFLRTAKTVNTMVDQLSSFASEVTRVAREVGT